MINENDKVLLSTQMDVSLLEFLANVDKLRSKFKDRFQMTKGSGKDQDQSKNTKAKEEKDKGKLNSENQQKERDLIRERRPWGAEQQRFSRPQRFQDNWGRFNNWPEERANWPNNLRYGEVQRRIRNL